MSDWTDSLESGYDVDTEEKGRVTCATSNIRFWMPNGAERKIVFAEDQPAFAFWEHSLKIGKSFRNYATCLTYLKVDCILCAIDAIQKYKAIPFTIIDRNEFTLKKGEKAGMVIKDSKRILVAKAATFEKIARRAKKLKEEGKSLKGAQFTVCRSKDPKSSSTGDDFEYDKHVDLKEFADVTPYDYKELFAPNPELVQKYVLQMKLATPSEEHDGVEEGTTAPKW